MQDNSPSREQMKLLKYLDEFDKQISNRRSSPSGLEEQLASLSRAYNQAQEKLLDTEKALMAESVLLQKQRSVIDIYKCALNEQLDEQGLLYFLQQLQADESNKQIYEDIAQVRNIITRRKLQGTRKNIQEERVKELKAEIARVTQDNSVIAEQNEKIHSSCYEAQMANQQLKGQLEIVRQEMSRKEIALESMAKLLEEEKITNQKLSHQIATQTKAFEALSAREKKMRNSSEEMERILKSKLGLCWGSQQDENISSLNDYLPSLQKTRGQLQQLQEKLSQLAKYKMQYKKLKEMGNNSDFLKRQVTLLKLFLSDEALNLFKEFQLHRQDCIQTELRNLALLERSRLLQLEEAQKDIWRYKIQLMIEEDEPTRPNPRGKAMTASVNPNLTGTSTQGPPAALIHSLQIGVSQFASS